MRLVVRGGTTQMTTCCFSYSDEALQKERSYMNLFKHHNAAALHQPASKMNDNDTPLAFFKIILAWIVATFSTIAERVLALDLAHWVQLVALVFTLFQLLFLLRDKWWRERKTRRGKRRVQYDRSSSDKTRA